MIQAGVVGGSLAVPSGLEPARTLHLTAVEGRFLQNGTTGDAEEC